MGTSAGGTVAEGRSVDGEGLWTARHRQDTLINAKECAIGYELYFIGIESNIKLT